MSLKDKLVSRTGSISGVAAFLGSYQVCHAVCMWIVGLLAVLGITVLGMPLLVLQKVAIPFWIAAVALFLASLLLYFFKRCLSKNLLLFNFGVITAGVPFAPVQNYAWIFWSVGGIFIFASIFLYVHERFTGRRR